MKKTASILLLALFPFTIVLATRTNEQHSSVPILCDASDESSEEKCDTVNILNGPLLKSNDFKVRYLLYKNPDNAEEYHEIFFNNISSIIHANPNKNAVWKILVHGFTNNKDTVFPKNVKEAYLKTLKKNPKTPINILVFDWGDGAKYDYFSFIQLKGIYQNAVENVQLAGEKLGKMITFLYDKDFLNITDEVHLVGHSLGAHVSGEAARQVYKETELVVWRISGLDPAGPLFWDQAILFWLHRPYPRLHRSRAAFLDVYHSSTHYGNMEEMGDVDFYINGGESQPGCDYKGIWKWISAYAYRETQSCSHQFAPQLFAKSINNETMIACTGCFSYEEYHAGNCTCNDDPDEQAVLGEHVVDEGYRGYPLASGEAFFDINIFEVIDKP